MIPKEAAQIILDQAVAVAGSQEVGLGSALITGLLLANYSAIKGMSSLIEGLNVAYDEAETRGFIKNTLVTLCLTFLCSKAQNTDIMIMEQGYKGLLRQ